MPARPGDFTQSDQAKQRIKEAATAQWQDPEIRARRQEALKAAWARKKESLGICPSCGQPLPEETGR
jgi:RNA polymerase-binding transcription factor DksA